MIHFIIPQNIHRRFFDSLERDIIYRIQALRLSGVAGCCYISNEVATRVMLCCLCVQKQKLIMGTYSCDATAASFVLHCSDF